MSSFIRIASHDTMSPPVDFTFADPSVPRPQGAPNQLQPSFPTRDRNSFISDAPGKFQRKPPRTEGVGNKSHSKTVKPGPITSAELFSSTNTFKPRVEKSKSTSNFSNTALLRREVFKPAHTSVAPSCQTNKTSSPMFRLNRRELEGSGKPLQSSNQVTAKAQLQTLTGYLDQPHFVDFETPPLSSKPNATDGDSHSNGICDELETLGGPSRSMSPSSTIHRNTLNTDISHTSEPTSPVSPHRNRAVLVLAPKTPSRRSVDHSTLSCTCDTSKRLQKECLNLKLICGDLEARHNASSKQVSTLSEHIEHIQNEKDQTEEALHVLRSQHAVALQKSSTLVVKSQEELAELRQEYQDFRSTNIEQLSNDAASLRQEIRDATAAVKTSSDLPEEGNESSHPRVREIFTEYQDLCTKLEGQVLQQQGVVDLLREELSRVYGNYSEALEQKQELHASLTAMAATQADPSKALNELQKQQDDLLIECCVLRNSENSATEKLKDLEHKVSVLTADHNQARELLLENEQAFAQRLKKLEEENNTLSRDLEKTRNDHTHACRQSESLKRAQSETLAQTEILRQERESLMRDMASLERDLALKGQSIDATVKANKALELELAKAEHKLNQYVEIERSYQTQALELKNAQSELDRANHEMVVLQEKLKTAIVHQDRANVLESALTKSKSALECLNTERTHLMKQIAQMEDSHNAQAKEHESLLKIAAISNERELGIHTELHVLRDQQTREQGLLQTLEQKLDSLLSTSEEVSAAYCGSQQQIAGLIGKTSDQKDEIHLLKQKIADANTRCSEHEANANLQRSEAETARNSVIAIEGTLNQKMLELESLGSKVQALEAASAESVMTVDSALESHVLEQEHTIEALRSEIAGMKNDVETISERYRTNALAESEKNFIVEISADFMREKDRATQRLDAAIKHKDHEIASINTNVKSLQESLAQEIDKTKMLSAQLAKAKGHSPDNDPIGLMRPPSSALSSVGPPAPDHDEPVPDRPVNLSDNSTVPYHKPSNASKQKTYHHIPAQMELAANNGTDDIQEFEESELARTSALGTRKRRLIEVEVPEDAEMEEFGNKRKATGKTKKGGKAVDTNNPRGQPADKDTSNSINTRGKTAKRRKA